MSGVLGFFVLPELYGFVTDKKIGPQCVHVWLSKLSSFLVSGVSLGFY